MPQLQITDQAKHVWRLALRGINSPPFPPSALTPATTFITGRKNIVSCPLTNTCQFQEKELLFFQPSRENKVFLRPAEKKEQEEKASFFFVALYRLLLCLSPSVSLFGHWVLPCHSCDSSQHNSNGAEILFVIRYGNSTVISQMMPTTRRPNNSLLRQRTAVK